MQEFKQELSESAVKTWYHLIILETVTFKAYTPLGDKEEDKSYRKLHYHSQIEYIKNFIMLVGYGKPEIAEHYLKMYEKATDKAVGKTQKMIINVGSVLLVSALAAATAGMLAGPAVAGKETLFCTKARCGFTGDYS